MDGFVREALTAKLRSPTASAWRPHALEQRRPSARAADRQARSMCSATTTARDIPNCWAYARHFVLQDRMFEATTAWSLPAHLFVVSALVRAVLETDDPASCRNDFSDPRAGPAGAKQQFPPRPALRAGPTSRTCCYGEVSWGVLRRSRQGARLPTTRHSHCHHHPLRVRTPSDLNRFRASRPCTATASSAMSRRSARFVRRRAQRTLPAVSWIVPDFRHSEHPRALISKGQACVTHLVNTVMGARLEQHRDLHRLGRLGRVLRTVGRRSTRNGYGLRVPALVISPYAERGYIDHQTLSLRRLPAFSRTTSSAALVSTRPPTVVPTAADRARERPRSSATSRPTSTSRTAARAPALRPAAPEARGRPPRPRPVEREAAIRQPRPAPEPLELEREEDLGDPS